MAAPVCRSIATATEFQTFTSFRERTIVQGQTQVVFDPTAVGITTVLSINRAGNTVSVRSRITGVTVTTIVRVTTVSTSTILSSSAITTLFAPCTVTTTSAFNHHRDDSAVDVAFDNSRKLPFESIFLYFGQRNCRLLTLTQPAYLQSTTPSTSAPPSTITVVSTIPISSSTSASPTTSAARGGQVSNASSKPNTGAIAGGVVGGVVALLALAALLWFCCCGQKRNKKHESFDFGNNDAWDPVGGVAAAGAGAGAIGARGVSKRQGNATQRASSYSRRSTGFNYSDDDDMDDATGIGRRGTATAPVMASVGAAGAGLGATYAARQHSQKRKKATPADEQDAYYASLPPPPREGSITPSSMSSAGGFSMAGVGVSRYSQYGPQDARAQHELYNGQEIETMRPNDSGWAAANRMQQAPYNSNGIPQRNSMGGGPQGYGAVPTASPPRQMARGPQQNLTQRFPQAYQPQDQRFPSSVAYNAHGGLGVSASPAPSHQSLPGLAGGWNGVGNGERMPGALRVRNEEPEMTEEERRFGGQPDAYDGLTDGLDRVASPGRAPTYSS
ncbi:BQ2448_874 [Microbotryum intermedium]|uniref:BQ2448_874 protein n=1 Tax=Microbotryum intermedium TaxID=269621 RepID=A0A238F9R3_9BASI|nr:BQ2448_874 [Microbotryum intermedium]